MQFPADGIICNKITYEKVSGKIAKNISVIHISLQHSEPMKGWRPRVTEQSLFIPVTAPRSHPRLTAGTGTSPLSATDGAPQPGTPAPCSAPAGSCTPHSSVGRGAALPGRAGQSPAPPSFLQGLPHFLTKLAGVGMDHAAQRAKNPFLTRSWLRWLKKTTCPRTWPWAVTHLQRPSQRGPQFTSLLSRAVVRSSVSGFYTINDVSFVLACQLFL